MGVERGWVGVYAKEKQRRPVSVCLMEILSYPVVKISSSPGTCMKSSRESSSA